MAHIITFAVPGVLAGATRGRRQAPAAVDATLPAGWTVAQSVQVSAARSSAGVVPAQAEVGRDVVRLRLAQGPELFLSPESARDLLASQQGLARGAARSGPAKPGDPVAVPAQLHWAGLESAAPTRGFIGDVLLSAFDVLRGPAEDAAAQWAADQVVQQLDGRVEEGVYQLTPTSLGRLKAGDPSQSRRLDRVPPAPGPLLVMIHGTFVETSSTFGKLWNQHEDKVAALFGRYDGRVYALDHRTLGASPVANALSLVRALPADSTLHLVTHSRGGLVAEVLARMAHQRAFGSEDRRFFPGQEWAALRGELETLATEMAQRRVRVERVVRVACPARGTLLAGKRLDVYLSALKWTLELAQVPVLPELVHFITEVARHRADPNEIPGLAAMIPGHPLLDWLNAAPQAIAGDLRVVAGDLEGDSVSGWIKTLLADAFYWTDNDIVVHTRSMYAGAPRLGGATRMLDQGGKVTHFNYFANESTAKAVTQALLNPAPPEGFFAIGRLSWEGRDSSGTRAGPARSAAPAADPSKPAVFVLPGILGTNLAVGGRRVWLDLGLIGSLEQLAYDPANGPPVTVQGPVGLVYDDLIEHLRDTHEVIPFGFDWRAPIEDCAALLAAAVDQALQARRASGQPVRLLAHSMGGLVARAMQWKAPKTWQALFANPQARLLMLGTPNAGSWAPMQVLSGDDTFGNTLIAFGAPFTDHRARQMMAAMPGFIQLQAGLDDPALKLAFSATWQALADADFQQLQQQNWWNVSNGAPVEAAYRWGVPPQAVLDQAVALRRALNEQAAGALQPVRGQVLLVVGQAPFTPAGFDGGGGGKEFTYRAAVQGGDGRVTLESALLPGVATWCVSCDHGSLPSHAQAFNAYVELLEHGQTQQLSPLPAAAAATRGRGPSARATPQSPTVPSRPSREHRAPTPAQDEADVFRPRTERADAPARRGLPVQVRVLNGDLTYVAEPLLLGHYRSVALTGTEKAVNRLLGGSLEAALTAGLYPDAVGSQQLFVNRHADPANPFTPPRPQAAIIVGLGDEGTLDERELAATVRQGVLAWAQRLAEEPGRAGTQFDLSATLAGSGGVGVSAGAAALAIVEGAQAANDAIRQAGWPELRRLSLIELYLDRAHEAWRALHEQADADPRRLSLEPTIATGTGARRRQNAGGYRGVDYDMVRIAGDGKSSLEFSLGGRRARTEVVSERTPLDVVRDLVSRGAQLGPFDRELGRLLFRLLVPEAMEAQFTRRASMVLDLDRQTAPIPWELLDAGSPGEAGVRPESQPWAIRSKLLRKLRLSSYRPVVRDARLDDHVLIVADPLVPKGWLQLPQAELEGRLVYELFTGPEGVGAARVMPLLKDAEAGEVITGLLAREYRIVHIAAHGQAVADEEGRPQAGGVVLSRGFLDPDLIAKMRTVPELVFLNCCHLGGTPSEQVLKDRSRFAATVAEKLIEIGVRCVVAAGWAVEEVGAKEFARGFYGALLAGKAFIDAVHAGRVAAFEANRLGNTWGAYQCYGDPDWTFRKAGGDANRARTSAAGEQTIASVVALARLLEDWAIQWQHTPAPDNAEEAQAKKDERLQRLEALAQRYGPDSAWGQVGAVAEAFALCFEALGERDQAIDWYVQALSANQATASLRAAEQLGNLRVRQAWGVGRKAEPGKKAFDDAFKQITEARAALLQLALMQPTQERWSLVGSADKRLAMMHARAGRADEEAAVLHDALKAYGEAERLARERGASDLYYPAGNRMALQLRLGLGTPAWVPLDPQAIDAAAAALEAVCDAAPDFWNTTSRIELEVYRAISAQRLAQAFETLKAEFARAYLRKGDPGEWGSVHEQAELVLERYAQATPSKEEGAAARALKAQLASYAAGTAAR